MIINEPTSVFFFIMAKKKCPPRMSRLIFRVTCKKTGGTLVVPLNDNRTDGDAYVLVGERRLTPHAFETEAGIRTNHRWRHNLEDENGEPVAVALRKSGIKTGKTSVR